MTDAGKVSYVLMYSKELETALLDTFSLEPADDGFVLTGACPVCGDRTSMPVPTALATIPTAGMLSFAQPAPSGLPGSKRLGYIERGGHVPEPYDVNLYCSCPVQHDPKQEKRGCGAWARLHVTLEADNEQQPSVAQASKDQTQPTDYDAAADGS